MKNFISIILISIFIYSCEKKQGFNVPIIEVDSSTARESTHSDFDSINFISIKLPDSVFLGEITHIKTYGNYLFLHDENQTKTITVFDRSGEFIGQLNRPGQGPEEFVELSAFTFDEKTKTLYIYDRSQLNIQAYSFPSFGFIRTHNTEKFIMNLELLDSNRLLQVSENGNSDGSYEGLLVTDLDGQLIDLPQIGNEPASIEISYPNTISRIDGNVIYAHPYAITTLYKIGDTSEPLFQIDFGENKIPESYWRRSDSEDFEEAFVIDPPKAIWVQNVWLSNSQVSFDYLFKDIDTRYTVSYNRENLKVKVFDRLVLPNTSILIPASLGVSNIGSLSILYADSIDPEEVLLNDKLNGVYNQLNKDQDLVIVEYRLKR
jgi:hypothetical protein